ncbi:MAG: PilW family protein [Oligosphaeraceae bacterium]
MKTNDNGRARRGAMAFTLVEIMVAVGMLMLIMSFLFQFVLGSQRLWSASNHTGLVFDNAQLVMDMLGQDVRNLQYANQVGRSRPFYYADQGLNSITFEGKALPASKTKMFLFITQANEAADSRKTTLYPVIYLYVGDTYDDSEPLIRSISNTLFRVVLARHNETGSSDTGDDGGLSDVDLTKVRQFPLIDYTTTLNSAAATANNALKKDLVQAIRSLKLTEEDILMEDVSGFDWQVYAVGSDIWSGSAADGYFLKETPASFQVQLRVFCLDAINGDEWAEQDTEAKRQELLADKYERSFTKRFFVANPASGSASSGSGAGGGGGDSGSSGGDTGP